MMRNSCGDHAVRGVKIALCIVAAIALALIFGYFVMLLWNWLIPSVFAGMKEVTYWQATGLLVLARLLFGSCGHGKSDHHHRRWHEWLDRHCGKEAEQYYDDWWQAEGKKAFESYVEAINQSEPTSRE